MLRTESPFYLKQQGFGEGSALGSQCERIPWGGRLERQVGAGRVQGGERGGDCGQEGRVDGVTGGLRDPQPAGSLRGLEQVTSPGVLHSPCAK